MPKDEAAPATPEADDVLELLHGLAGDAKDAYESIKKKIVSGALNDPAALATEVVEMFSILADATQFAFQAHKDHFEWGSEVDEDLDDIKARLTTSTLLAEDASMLKGLIFALSENLRSPTGPDDDVPAILKKRATDALAFIDQMTEAEADDEGDEDEDEETN